MTRRRSSATCVRWTIIEGVFRRERAHEPAADRLRFRRGRAWIADIEPEITISDFGWGEFVSALPIRVRAGATTPELARALLSEQEANIRHWPKIAITSADLANATGLAARPELGLRLPDAIHVANARRIGQLLVTRDQQQASAARAIGLPAINPDHPE